MQRVTNPQEQSATEKRFNQLMAEVYEVAKRNQAFAGTMQSTIIDVPDNGNCLFYALGVGLRKSMLIILTYKKNYSGKYKQSN